MAASVLRVALLALVITSLTAGGLPGPAASTDDSAGSDWQTGPPSVTFPFQGGTITMPIGLETGERFLQLVPPPVFTRTQEALQNPRLQPGDGGDEGPVVLERRHTDYSYMAEDWTGGMRIIDVQGTPEAYVCVCDATFIMTNNSGLDPTRPLRIIDSEYLWFDNLTIYGGGIDFWDSQSAIVSHSLFIDSAGVGSLDSSDGYVHNITTIRQRPPTNMINHPPEPLGREFACFLHYDPPPCTGGGVGVSGGARWTIEWSYFLGAGGAGSETDTNDLTIRHNTFRDTLPFWSGGTNEISWNLIRGTSNSGPSAWGNDYTAIHNNSIILPFKVGHQDGVTGNAGLMLPSCTHCDIRHNDFIGYGLPHPLNSQCCPALLTWGTNYITANDNYWGTLHDPRIPGGFWIKHVHPDQVELVLDRWETQPIHDVTPLMYTIDQDDVPWWLQQLTGLPVYPLWQDLDLP